MTDVVGPCFHARMGRHEAVDGAAPHPVVAEALHRRPATGGAHRRHTDLPGTEGPIGWPGPEPDEQGEPIGWPGGPSGGPGAQPPQDDETADEPEPPAPDQPTGWRRLLGRSRAA